MPNPTYTSQFRGDDDAYASYYAGMDKSMAQKVALVTSYLGLTGKVADMGSGSGKGSYDFARLFERLQIVGVDISEESVAYSDANYRAPNLAFKKGDVAEQIFEPGELDAIINSSVLHHVTSFNDNDVQRLYKLLDSHVAQLKTGGIITIRDFVIPAENKDILLELPADDGDDTTAHGAPTAMSTARLFEAFCRDFRCAAFPRGHLPFAPVGARGRTVTYRVNNRVATEFILRKDYREDWEVEMLEEYQYFTQQEFEREFLRRSLRILLSRPICNQWVIRNRWLGRVSFRDLDGTPIDLPATNYVIVGRKVPLTEGVVIKEQRATEDKPRFLQLAHYREDATGAQWDVATRPGETIDIVPWFRRDSEVHVLARSEFPRPITQARGIDRPADDMFISGYATEPLTLLHTTEAGDAHATILSVLASRAHVRPEAIRAVTAGPSFFPSPGASAERVSIYYVEIETPAAAFDETVSYEGVSAHQVREFNVSQLLRAYKVGGLVDVRLEIAAYELLARLETAPGPWIEQAVMPPSLAAGAVPLAVWADLQARLDRRNFTPLTGTRPSYLEFRRGNFAEYSWAHQELRTWELEYFIPRQRSTNTVTVAAVAQVDSQWCLGLEERHLAPVQHLTGQSGVLTIPAWRLPKNTFGDQATSQFVTTALKDQYGCDLADLLALGGSYFPSPGLSPEYALPFIAVIANPTEAKLAWVPLAEALTNRADLHDGHLLVSLWRASHMARG